MKKILSMFLVFSMILICSLVIAEDTGIQVIGSPEAEAETVNLDDWEEGDMVEIPGFGNI